MKSSNFCLVYLFFFTVCMAATEDDNKKGVALICMAVMAAAYQICSAIEVKK